MSWGYRYGYRGYFEQASAYEKQERAERDLKKLRKKGQAISPVTIEGGAIARTFWGKAWSRNLERYSDYSNRLPRGRSYVRSGAVVDLQIGPGQVRARVSGSSLYEVHVKVAPLSKACWDAVCRDCAGGIDSLVELLQGRLSQAVMERVCEEGRGLFPAPRDIEFGCSCPDWASMCKHVAAVLYGVGARLDEKPELLFQLRKVDHQELVAHAGAGAPLEAGAPGADKVLDGAELGELFGLELAAPAALAGGLAAQAREYVAKAKPRAGTGPADEAQIVVDDALRAKVAAAVEAAFAPYRELLDRAAAFLGVELDDRRAASSATQRRPAASRGSRTR